MPLSSARLWVVATPIGNLGDLSPRAKKVLGQVDLILAEDTRDAQRLLTALEIAGKPLISLYEHNERARIGQVLGLLAKGKELALISSAGTPLISDPGYRLVKECRERGVLVLPVPGPCAPVAALMASGFPPLPFLFLGFLPRRAGEIRALFQTYGLQRVTLIFFERKSRITSSLGLAFEILGERQVCLARELTKQYEEFIYLKLSEHGQLGCNLRGEFTVLIAPALARERTSQARVEDLLRKERDRGVGTRALSKKIAAQVQGWKASEIYELSLVLTKGEQE